MIRGSGRILINFLWVVLEWRSGSMAFPFRSVPFQVVYRFFLGSWFVYKKKEAAFCGEHFVHTEKKKKNLMKGEGGAALPEFNCIVFLSVLVLICKCKLHFLNLGVYLSSDLQW